jgi:hypothetical protein
LDQPRCRPNTSTTPRYPSPKRRPHRPRRGSVTQMDEHGFLAFRILSEQVISRRRCRARRLRDFRIPWIRRRPVQGGKLRRIGPPRPVSQRFGPSSKRRGASDAVITHRRADAEPSDPLLVGRGGDSHDAARDSARRPRRARSALRKRARGGVVREHRRTSRERGGAAGVRPLRLRRTWRRRDHLDSPDDGRAGGNPGATGRLRSRPRRAIADR